MQIYNKRESNVLNDFTRYKIISDEFGVPNHFFDEQNVEETASGQTIIPARLFMYVIGRDMGELDSLQRPKHMACRNKGIQIKSAGCTYLMCEPHFNLLLP